MNKNHNRLFLGGLIALLGGISYGMTILPWATEELLTSLPADTFLRMARTAVPAALLWIPGGALTGLQGGGRNGLKIMGIAGLVVGAIYGFIVGSGNLNMVGLGAAVAALYGAGAGLLIGGGLPRPEAE